MALVHPKQISIADYTYELPNEKIAKYPLPERDLSKLLVYKNGEYQTSQYQYLADFLPAKSLLVFNNTKVVEARLQFKKSTGGAIEIFCLEPDDQYPDITTAMLEKGRVLWKCLVGGAKKWKDEILSTAWEINNTTVILSARLVERLNDCFLIEFYWTIESLSFAELLHLAGEIPLPPYLNRAAEASDKTTYQTIYAAHDGSVAAPTAGLHFTERLFNRLNEKHIDHCFVTLHVGAGTFKPVKAEKMDEHEMHAEFIDVDIKAIKYLLHHLPHPIIPVGTTSLRTIESLYWLGVKLSNEDVSPLELLQLSQWDAYDLPQFVPTSTALEHLINWLENNQLNRVIAKTQLLIAPGYTLRIAQAIITNFHQPSSTLLLLVAAFIGDEWRNVYQYALDNDFRFLSYGDGSLLFPTTASTT